MLRRRAILQRARLGWHGRRDFALTAGANAAIAVASAVAGILAARLLGPEGRGVFAVAIVWAAIFGTVTALGLTSALAYVSAREPQAIGRIFHTALVLWVCQSVVVVGGGSLVVVTVLTPLQPEAAAAARIYLWSIPCTQLVIYLAAMAQGLGRFTLFNVAYVGPAVSSPTVLALALIIGWRTPVRVVWALLLAQVVVAAVVLVLFVWRIRPRGTFSRPLARQVLHYGLRSYWGGLAWLVNVRLDQFIMSALVSLADLGTYAVASSYAAVLMPLSSTVTVVVFPRVARDDFDTARRRIRRAWRATVVMVGAFASLLVVLSPWLLPLLFGREYQAAIGPAAILLVAGVFLGSSQVLGSGLRALGLPTTPSAAEFVGMLITVTGLFLVLPHGGMIGAAGVSLVSYACVSVILWHALRRTTSRGPG